MLYQKINPPKIYLFNYPCGDFAQKADEVILGCV